MNARNKSGPRIKITKLLDTEFLILTTKKKLF